MDSHKMYNAIRQMRIKRGLQVNEYAKAVNWTEDQLLAFEAGELQLDLHDEVDMKRWIMMANKLNVAPEALLFVCFDQELIKPEGQKLYHGMHDIMVSLIVTFYGYNIPQWKLPEPRQNGG